MSALQRRYFPPPPALHNGNIARIHSDLVGLFGRKNPHSDAALRLKDHLMEEACALSVEAFTRFMDRIHNRITVLLESDNVAENFGGLRGVDLMIDVEVGELASKYSRFVLNLRYVFDVKRDRELLVLASKVLGHLARVGGPFIADEVEQQVRIALDWLYTDRVEFRLFAAVLIFREVANNASTVFNVHLHEFVDAIWIPLRDPTLAVREYALEALRACLRVIEMRETRWRVQWYYHMFEDAQDGLSKNAPIHSIHGSLVAVAELLRNTGEFMMSRYREMAEIVLRYLEHRDRLVRISISSLLPRIAHFLRDQFVTNYLTVCMNHIFTALRTPAERPSGFIALGEIAAALNGDLIHYLPTISFHLREAIAPRRGKPSLEALACVGSIAKAMGPITEPYVRGLLDLMFDAGLSPALVDALEQITVSIPYLLPSIQDRLLNCISIILSKTHYPRMRPVTFNKGSASSTSRHFLDASNSDLVQLAFQTLARFNFKGHDLLEFARKYVIVYLDDEDGATRKGAALCFCSLVATSFSGVMCTQFGSSISNRIGGKQYHLVEEIVEKLLTTAVADADIIVRRSVFSFLHRNRSFDDFLAQAESLSAVFAALNDEDFDVREYAISVAGRLSEKNPAYVLPVLRCHLIQLLTYLKQSADSRYKDESVILLGCLIRNCEGLIYPYFAPIHKAVVSRLMEVTGVNSNYDVVSGVLATIGDLSRMDGFAMRKSIPELMPLIVEALLDGAAPRKREVAVVTLGQVVQSTGYVISPYNEYPQLLGLLLKLLNGGLPWSTRREVLKVLGITGAIDPHVHKRNQHRLSDLHRHLIQGSSDSGQHIQSIDEIPIDIWRSFVVSEDFYSMVAINSLMQILRDASLASYHQKVVKSLTFILKSMGVRCVPYLPKVLPDLFLMVRKCDEQLKDLITWKLGTIVSIAPKHIRKYLPELCSLISEFWSTFSSPASNRPQERLAVLHLVEQLCLALNDDFRIYLPEILPCCIQVLSDAERSNDYTHVLEILHTLEVFGGTLNEHMHLLLPVLIRLFKVVAPFEIRRAAIKTLTRLIPCVQVTGHVSSLVHHLKLVLNGNHDELRKDAADALCCLAQALGEDFTVFIPCVHKLLLKHSLQHMELEEIVARYQRREPLIFGSMAAQRFNRQLPVEVKGDPLSDGEDDPYEDMSVTQRQLRHQVTLLFTQTQVSDLLRTAGEASQHSTKEDWAEWMRHFSIELLKMSPSPALRTCAKLAQVQPFVGRQLFAAGFVSCWSQLQEASQKQLVRSLETAFSSPNIPPEIIAKILNLAEFMEHDEKPLPIDIRLLCSLSEKCHAFAKALHYKEMEFQDTCLKKRGSNPVVVVETLIHINKQLHNHEAAVGILTFAQQHLGVQLKESWYEKLQQWDDALGVYTAKASQGPSQHGLTDATLGQMRCLAALARWEELNNLCKGHWTTAESAERLELAPMAASAAWNLGEWDHMAEYVAYLDSGNEAKIQPPGHTTGCGDGSSNGAFFRAVLSAHGGKYSEAREYVEQARKCLATDLAALVPESYEHAYRNFVRVQQLSELEEVIDYCNLHVGNPVSERRRVLIRKMWNERIRGAKRNVEVWQALLAVRELVLPPEQDVDTWLKFSSLCRKKGQISQAKSALVKILKYDPEVCPDNVPYIGPPQVVLAFLKCQWSLGEECKRKEAFSRLQNLAMELSTEPSLETAISNGPISLITQSVPVLARVYLKLGTWQWALSPELDDKSIQEINVAFRNASRYASNWGKTWHIWALFNTTVTSHYALKGSGDLVPCIVAAVTGFFQSIACAALADDVDDSLQDILRLLTLWFNHGHITEVQLALQRGFSHLNITTWLAVLPQIIARIHSNTPGVQKLIQSLLVQIGESHPQALMYPLLVACKSISSLRRAAAQEVVDKVRQHSGVIVDQAQLVSKELIRVAILWHEMWHEAIEEASRLYFGEHDIMGMLKVLEPMHEMLEEEAKSGSATVKERAFMEAFRDDLLEAYECCQQYKKTGKEAAITQAWDLYYYVFRRIDKQLRSLTSLSLQSVSPELLECRNLDLAVPGTYHAGLPVVTIASFASKLVVITSKQRPRKLTIYGSDGEDYTFLLKGHEDLRQDERVMQLFGLVNTLLENSRNSAGKDLSIQRYAVIPLSPNSGLIGWVSNCDILHNLIVEYRDARKIVDNQEHRHMLSFAPDYESLPLIAKVEVFEYALQNTEGDDLARILWLKSPTSEIWLERRTNYTRSLAVMSMVGYLLGLGDRHPSNLMLHRHSGKIVHIDFGDCFEASMNREKFPEKVPFRLTRMVVKAMEVGGIEGTFRLTCENVMRVLRTNRDSIMAMMEAFVHDPLINWRLLNFNEAQQMPTYTNLPILNEVSTPSRELAQPTRGTREREILQAVNQLNDASEVLHERAVAVMTRMRNKITGCDFSSYSTNASNTSQQAMDHKNLNPGNFSEVEHGLSVKQQVEKLIIQATSHENLCQNYIGWCPFW